MLRVTSKLETQLLLATLMDLELHRDVPICALFQAIPSVLSTVLDNDKSTREMSFMNEWTPYIHNSNILTVGLCPVVFTP